MPDATIIPFALPLPQVLPTIEGNVDYRQLRDQLLRIDSLLTTSGLETRLMEKDLARWLGQHQKVSAKAQQNRQCHCRRALRCNLARLLIQEDYRGFAARLADSPLLQWFCGVSELPCITVPSKSTLERYDKWWPQAEIRQAAHQLLGLGATAPRKLALPEAVDLESAFLDTTCLAANIHYPVDWVLLRDATRTLMKAVQLIRGQGLKHRMEEPQSFLTRINRLCIQMTHAGSLTDSQRHRQKTLRQMDNLVGRVRAHARRYRDLLEQSWAQTQWTQPQAQQVLRRMDGVLEQIAAGPQTSAPAHSPRPAGSQRGQDLEPLRTGRSRHRAQEGRRRSGVWQYVVPGRKPARIDSGLGAIPRKRAGGPGTAALERRAHGTSLWPRIEGRCR
jgi:hypothetical protein